MNIKKIQQYLNENKIDVWLIYSFRDNNPLKILIYKLVKILFCN